jgi:hypothetical protein
MDKQMNIDPAPERHSRKCAICTHPDRDAIDETFHRNVSSDSISNRNAFRLETARTPKTQAANPNSNREPQRLETPVTPTKQRPSPSSNRENKAPSQAPNPQSQPNPESKSNREPLRLEIPVTPTKQTPDPDPNREKEALFSEGARTMVNAEIQKMLIGKQ